MDLDDVAADVNEIPCGWGGEEFAASQEDRAEGNLAGFDELAQFAEARQDFFSDLPGHAGLAETDKETSRSPSAAAALKLAGEHSFDMIISDLGLPDMIGYELMRQIKLNCGIEGIAMRGYGMEEDIKKGQQAGIADHLVKPVSFAQLEQSIRRVSNGHRQGCQKVTTNPI